MTIPLLPRPSEPVLGEFDDGVEPLPEGEVPVLERLAVKLRPTHGVVGEILSLSCKVGKEGR